MSDIDEIINNIKDLNKFKYDVFVKDLMSLATRVKGLEQQNKRYREAFHEIRRIDNDPDVNYCEFSSLAKDIVDESLKNG